MWDAVLWGRGGAELYPILWAQNCGTQLTTWAHSPTALFFGSDEDEMA